MRFIPKRLSLHMNSEPRRRRKPPKKQYFEMVSDSEGSSDESDEAVTPRSSGSDSSPSVSTTAPELFADLQGTGYGNFVQTMRIIKNERQRKTTIEGTGNVDFMSDIPVQSRRPLSDAASPFSYPSPSPSPSPSPFPFTSSLLPSSPLATDQQMKEHAIYIASRIRQQLSAIFDGVQLRTWGNRTPLPEVSSVEMTRMIANRLYTYARLCASRTPECDAILARLDANIQCSGDSLLASRRAGREAHYAVRYTFDQLFRETILPSQKTVMVERTRRVMERCFESEEKLSPSERECMYAFHRLMSGVRWEDPNAEVSLCGMMEC